ncbi:ABC transporter permease [Desertivirga xinjiangensis]|uniref:ABC transporter permease n=1 Tax=Desertivirga xinjiangensis TaxID=539206 RepID=UPI00210CDF16|nr:ABC transporter permease [Pedobacter xinjiangensis]
MDFYLTALLQGLCFSAIAAGIFISMKIFNIPDITTDGSYALGGAVTGVLLSADYSLALVFPLVALAGAGAGVCTGLIHTKLKINPLLSGILVMTALYSINLSLMGRSNIPLMNHSTLYSLLMLSDDHNLNTLYVLLFFVIVLLSAITYLLKTDFGISMRATGNSESMIRALGVNTDRMKITGLAIANSLTAISGFLMTQFQGFADINMGIGIVIVGLGSVIIAEAFINWFNISSVSLILLLVISGAIVFQLVLSLTLSLGIDATLLKLVTALFVLVIVSLPRISFRKKYD